MNDGLGSVRQLADGDGDVTLAQGYTPFGVLLWREGDAASGYGFTGEQEDVVVGLVFLRARYYDPYLNRFISPDTIIPDFTNPQSLNRYAYVYNNPLLYTDPSGHQGCKWWDVGCHGKQVVSKITDYWLPTNAPAIPKPWTAPPTSTDVSSWPIRH